MKKSMLTAISLCAVLAAVAVPTTAFACPNGPGSCNYNPGPFPPAPIPAPQQRFQVLVEESSSVSVADYNWRWDWNTFTMVRMQVGSHLETRTTFVWKTAFWYESW